MAGRVCGRFVVRPFIEPAEIRPGWGTFAVKQLFSSQAGTISFVECRP
jgi:hypothetical protein